MNKNPKKKASKLWIYAWIFKYRIERGVRRLTNCYMKNEHDWELLRWGKYSVCDLCGKREELSQQELNEIYRQLAFMEA